MTHCFRAFKLTTTRLELDYVLYRPLHKKYAFPLNYIGPNRPLCLITFSPNQVQSSWSEVSGLDVGFYKEYIKHLLTRYIDK